MSIALVDGANGKVRKLIYLKETQASYKSVQEAANKGFVTPFTTFMQILITKIALTISEVAVSVKLSDGYCYGAINYLCRQVLNDEGLYNDLIATKINEGGNDTKHTLNSIAVNIDQCVNQYNRLINKLISQLELTALAAIKVQKGESTAKTAKPAPTHNSTGITKTAKPTPTYNSTEAAKTVMKPANSKGVLKDAVGNLTVELSAGLGIINKHSLFARREVLNCNLSIAYEGEYSVKKITAYLDGGSEGFPVEEGDNVLELDSDRIKLPRVSITVEAIIKIKMFSTKSLKVTVSRNF